MHGNLYLDRGDFQVSAAYRWLHSDRHFRGDREEPERQDDDTEVVNDVHTLDFGLTYAISKRVNATLTLPLFYAERSSLYEHDRVNRHTTRAYGIGDVRLVGNAWLLNPSRNATRNVGFGAGVKAPTGDHNAMDTFQRPTGPERRPVDQSIQPGDGGWGVILEVQAFTKLFARTYGYLNGTYLINPREKNGTQTFRSTPGEEVMSVPDQYLGRIGLSYAVWPEKGLALSLGGRIEGVPVRDVIGGSDGFRRPGFAISVEPGLSWSSGANQLSLTAPVAVYRNRERSVADLRTNRHGDAAFADFLILFSYSRRF